MNDITTLPYRVSEHFTAAEVTHSESAMRAGIDNSVPADTIGAVIHTAGELERVRAALGSRPITVTSWYRCLQLNKLIGSTGKQHPKGEAVDFICPAFGTPLMICRTLRSLSHIINYDQLIYEHTWVHISWNSIPGAKQRNEVLTLLNSGKYMVGLPT